MKLYFLLLTIFSTNCFGITESEIKNWKDDLDFYYQNIIEKHIDPFHKVSEKELNEAIVNIKTSLSHLTYNQLLVELMRLTHSIGDGHTSIPLWGIKLNSFPIKLKALNDNFYVIKTTNNFKHLLGAKLEKINGINIERIYYLFSQLTPFSENKYSTHVRAAQYINKAELLNGLGIINNTDQARFTFKINGKHIVQFLKSNIENKYSSYISYNNNILFSVDKKINDELWFGSIKNKKVIYFKFHSYPSISLMESIGKDLLSFINQNQSEKLIIDLRDNYGGDFFTGLKLAQFLVQADSINWKSGVYVLINNVTFSAAMSNAAQFSQLLNAKLVGEPTGAKPSGYQDMDTFILPHSNLEVTYSKRLYNFTTEDRDALYPNVKIEMTIDDYLAGKDPQLNWILNNNSLN